MFDWVLCGVNPSQTAGAGPSKATPAALEPLGDGRRDGGTDRDRDRGFQHRRFLRSAPHELSLPSCATVPVSHFPSFFISLSLFPVLSFHPNSLQPLTSSSTLPEIKLHVGHDFPSCYASCFLGRSVKRCSGYLFFFLYREIRG